MRCVNQLNFIEAKLFLYEQRIYKSNLSTYSSSQTVRTPQTDIAHGYIVYYFEVQPVVSKGLTTKAVIGLNIGCNTSVHVLMKRSLVNIVVHNSC